MDSQDAIVRSADLRPETKTLATDLDRTPWPYQRAAVDAARGIDRPPDADAIWREGRKYVIWQRVKAWLWEWVE